MDLSQINQSSNPDFDLYDFMRLDMSLELYKPKFLYLWNENNNTCGNVGKVCSLYMAHVQQMIAFIISLEPVK